MRSYLKQYGNILFEDRPLNDIDLLVFAQLSYVNFSDESLKRGTPFCSVLKTVGGIQSSEPSEVRFRFQHKDDFELCSLAAQARRYRDITFVEFVSDSDPEQEKQFAVLTLRLPDDRIITAFRGTDNTLSGWKEDFNLAFMDSIPSQRMAATYIEGICREAREVILCGHSKGGNLALYAAVMCRPEVGGAYRARSQLRWPGPCIRDSRKRCI